MPRPHIVAARGDRDRALAGRGKKRVEVEHSAGAMAEAKPLQAGERERVAPIAPLLPPAAAQQCRPEVRPQAQGLSSGGGATAKVAPSGRSSILSAKVEMSVSRTSSRGKKAAIVSAFRRERRQVLGRMNRRVNRTGEERRRWCGSPERDALCLPALRVGQKRCASFACARAKGDPRVPSLNRTEPVIALQRLGLKPHPFENSRRLWMA